mgnify:CR=1 FL=1
MNPGAMQWFTDALRGCQLCPRRCGVDREAGQTGFCGAGASAEIYRYGPHHGEEPPLSGDHGSGTVFFSRCTLHCVYCQNYPWSQEAQGEAYTVEQLAGIFTDLASQGCHNVNLVSPTPWLPPIVAAAESAGRRGALPPMVYNTSGFERIEVIDRLAGFVDIYLTDLRYSREASAREGSGRGDLAETEREALRAMWAQTGPLRTDAQGIARRGTICRMLVLPGRAGEAVDNLRWIAEELGVEVPVSVMSQYHPAFKARTMPGWNRGLFLEEFDDVRREVERLGFENGWVQDLTLDCSEELLGFKMRAGRGE